MSGSRDSRWLFEIGEERKDCLCLCLVTRAPHADRPRSLSEISQLFLNFSTFSLFFFFFFFLYKLPCHRQSQNFSLKKKKWQSIDKDYILAINLTTLCRVIGKLLSRWRDQNWNGGGGCVRAYACDTIASREKTYEISKLGKHLPLQKSYKLPQLLAETTLKLPFSRWRFRLLCALARGFVFTSRLLYELDRDDNFSLERYKNKFVTKRYCAYIQAS